MPFPNHVPLENCLYLFGTHMHELQLKNFVFSFISFEEEVSEGPVDFLFGWMSDISLLDCPLEEVVPV